MLYRVLSYFRTMEVLPEVQVFGSIRCTSGSTKVLPYFRTKIRKYLCTEVRKYESTSVPSSYIIYRMHGSTSALVYMYSTCTEVQVLLEVHLFCYLRRNLQDTALLLPEVQRCTRVRVPSKVLSRYLRTTFTSYFRTKVRSPSCTLYESTFVRSYESRTRT